MSDERCPECGGHLVYVPETGEFACSACGLVSVQEERFTPGWMGDHSEPFSGVTKAARIPRLALAKMPEERRRALYRVGQLEPSEKMVTELYKCIKAAAAQLNITDSNIISEAHAYAVALKRGLMSSGQRMMMEEIAIASLWRVSQMHHAPLLLSDVERAYPEIADKLYKILSKSSSVIDFSVRPPKAVDYVKRMIAKISDFPDKEYVSAIEDYVIGLLREAEVRCDKLRGKDPVAIAGTAIHLADEELGSRIGRKVLEALGIKYNDHLAKILKELSPPLTDLFLKKVFERTYRETLYAVYKELNGRWWVENN
ncbi:MAG: hypothetical protein QW687_06455 [Candidatus Hadarchaeales archaeon]